MTDFPKEVTQQYDLMILSYYLYSMVKSKYLYLRGFRFQSKGSVMNTNLVLLHHYTWKSHSAVLWYFRLRSRGKILRSEGVMSLFFHFLIAWPSFPCVHWEFFNWKWKFLYLSPDYHSRWRAIKINEWRCASVRALKNCWGRLNTLRSHLGLRFSYRIFHLTFGLHSKGKGREGNQATCMRLASMHMCTSVRAHILAQKKMVYFRLLSIEQLRMQEAWSKCCGERLSSATWKTETLTL